MKKNEASEGETDRAKKDREKKKGVVIPCILQTEYIVLTGGKYREKIEGKRSR